MKKKNIFYSMKTGIILLTVIGLLSILGTVIPQERPLGWYEQNYNPVLFRIIRLFNLNDMYHTYWFIILFVLLAVNLIMCSIFRFPTLYRKVISTYQVGEKFTETNFTKRQVKRVYKKLGYPLPKMEGNIFYSSKGRIGYLGSWLTHLGFLIIIVSYLGSRIFSYSTIIHGIPNQLLDVEGTELKVLVEDFLIDYREDYSINQYYSYVQVFSPDREERGSISVNNPLKINGYNIYQSGTGWAVDLEIRKDNQLLLNKIVYDKDHIFLDEDTVFRVADFYPDLINHQNRPANGSPHPRNPYLIYQVFEGGSLVDMGLLGKGQSLQWEDYLLNFLTPHRYTVLEVSKDWTSYGALLGSLILLWGIFCSFYVKPTTLVARYVGLGKYSLFVYSGKGENDYFEKVRMVLKEVYSIDRSESL